MEAIYEKQMALKKRKDKNKKVKEEFETLDIAGDGEGTSSKFPSVKAGMVAI